MILAVPCRDKKRSLHATQCTHPEYIIGVRGRSREAASGALTADINDAAGRGGAVTSALRFEY